MHNHKSGAWELIVVGAGSAGAPLAARSAARGKRVLLIEAGPALTSAEFHPLLRSPNPARALALPELSEQLLYADLLATRTAHQQPELYWRGKGFGGSSNINGQLAIRPPLEDFDEWAAQGCVGWSGADVLPYFTRLESDADFPDESYHGADGPIPVFRTSPSNWGSMDSAFYAAAIENGYRDSDDLNAPGATGVSRYPFNARDLERVSTNDAYIEPLRGSKNLTAIGETVVDRVLFSNGQAIGVSTIRDGTVEEFYGDEIILSAGTIHTPTILIRSGIGPRATLDRLSIPLISELPVGQGLQDHPAVEILVDLTDEAKSTDPDQRHTNVVIRTDSGVIDGGAFNDLLICALNQNVMIAARANVVVGALVALLNLTYSRGSVTVVSTDPMAQPVVEENMLSDTRDRARLRVGVRMIAELAYSPAFAKISTSSPHERNPELFAVLHDDEALDKYMMDTASDTQHATSTCRMGDPEANTTVVDANCRVLGVGRLRVVDASVFPSVPRANTHLATVMLGEAMADRL